MALTKENIIDTAHKELGITNKGASKIIEILLEIMKRTMESGEEVMISGFGKFGVKEKAERKGRNPITGDSMMLGKRRVVTFKYSGGLRKKIN